ncbi:DNA-3-methyladenine glycosylase [Flavipsychrobacter stenotrophus]|uniref:Putative 3-methyladenine DNA glycosylase n=1 Tax=Flavipsychrobacter stenotrophus TaxID=2077091 RepID=A0A2S7ST30_9BACT|nr:DNA-3-methyladenine glycosylase [Flavipsychrobacter stenotrophus]PQJ09858.1 DNA-3-methyladenine glycosylase [Flavipsychrobacter stenotrophus]
MILPPSFYTRTDVVKIAKELLGKVIVTNIGGIVTSGMIVETEAYAGVHDKASHSYGGRNTERTKVMFMNGGVAYVYLCYGIHHLFNVITNVEGTPSGVLIRAVEPLEGVEYMLVRRKKEKLTPALTAGPGALSAALGINTALTGTSLSGTDIFIEDRGIKLPKTDIVIGTRVGVAYAAEDAMLPYRFSIKGNKYVSKGKGL